MMKNEWTTPKLHAIVRSKPEEMVLAVCKTGTTGGAATSTGTHNSGTQCYQKPSTCTVCSTTAAS